MIAGVEIRLGGSPIDSGFASHLLDVRVEDHLRMPDVCHLRFSDPGLEHVDSSPLDVGADVQISFSAPGQESLVKVFQGQIATVETEFAAHGVIIAARAYDYSHALNRTRRTETYQNATIGDVARKVAGRAGLGTGTIDDAAGVHDFIQQSNETDWDFLWRLAGGADFEVVVADRKLNFRKAGSPAGATPIAMRWGENLTQFRPRVTGIQQVDQVVVRGWDPKSKKAIEANAKVEQTSSQAGIKRSDVVSALSGGTLTIADRPVTTQDEANALAKSIGSQIGNAYVEADGAVAGDPRLRAGAKVSVERVGKRFGGSYSISSTTHVFRASGGYQTQFAIAGRAQRSLVELTSSTPKRDFSAANVIAIVTNNNDPDGLGRVRVRYPALGDDHEGWWARTASVAAGADRGVLMMPQVGDECLVTFEHGDPRKPYVIGFLWNGQDKPGDLVKTDGSFVLQSDKQIGLKAKDAITIKSDKDMTVETQGKIAEKATGDYSVEGQSVSIKAQTSLTIEAGSDLTIKCGGAKITLSAAGTVQVSGTTIALG